MNKAETRAEGSGPGCGLRQSHPARVSESRQPQPAVDKRRSETAVLRMCSRASVLRVNASDGAPETRTDRAGLPPSFRPGGRASNGARISAENIVGMPNALQAGVTATGRGGMVPTAIINNKVSCMATSCRRRMSGRLRGLPGGLRTNASACRGLTSRLIHHRVVIPAKAGIHGRARQSDVGNSGRGIQ
ncbi:MAG: hypothetical protein FD165_2147 [Gammaproteobacteria bacterium]|nr:MAG: hypothetical protein FD165_2147 [Gammaproteobacteria bacterium]TND05306.1 MAG: hypothetical protein FD120_1181 [Gammaproteobacteria bacterium]